VDTSKNRNEWALSLMSRGIIVRLSVSRWRAMPSLNDENYKSFKITNESLLPQNIMAKLEKLEAKARYNLDDQSYSTVWGHFVPYTAFENWKNKNDEIKKDFLDFALKVGKSRDIIALHAKQKYKLMAKEMWLKLYPNQGEATESFIEDFSNKIISSIPNESQIISSFKFETVYYTIPMPLLIKEDFKDLDVLEKTIKTQIRDEYIGRKQELIDEFLEDIVMGLRNKTARLCKDLLIFLARTKTSEITMAQRNRIQWIVKRINAVNFQNDVEICGLLNEIVLEANNFDKVRDKNVVVAKLNKIIEICKNDFLPNFSIDL
jgi:hypothetical protein